MIHVPISFKISPPMEHHFCFVVLSRYGCPWFMYWLVVGHLKKMALLHSDPIWIQYVSDPCIEFFPDIEVLVKQWNKMNFYMLTTPQNNYTMTQHCHHNTAVPQYNNTTTQWLVLTLYSCTVYLSFSYQTFEIK